MDPNPVILDISSDEDGGWDEPNDDQLDWLSELLDTADDETEDSDDVVVVGEVSCSSVVQKQRYKHLEVVDSATRDDFDDDCLILDGDPDNPVAVVNGTGNGSDELLIVGEKGQLACRDYPHPRHLCARFPFSSTPHEKYCDQCHCYVCDSLAPCNYWGTGVYNADHCHSTDKEEIWRVQRKCFKEGKVAPPAWKLPDTAFSTTPPLHNPGPALTLPQPLNSSSIPLHTVSKSIPCHASSSTTSFGMPNIVSHRNNQRSGLIIGRNRYPQHVSRAHRLMPSKNNITRNERVGSGGGTLGPQFISPHLKCKRTGGASTMNRYGLSKNSNHVYLSQSTWNHCPSVTWNDDNHTRRWQDFHANIDSDVPSQPNTSSSFTDVPLHNDSSQPDVFSQPIPQPNMNQNMYSLGHPALNTTNPNLPDFDLSWLDSTTQSIPEHPSAENPQLQSLQPTYPSPITESVPQCPENTNPASSEFPLDSWTYSVEHQPILGTAKDVMPSEFDFASPQPDQIDPAMLFYDFESPWNGPAHV